MSKILIIFTISFFAETHIDSQGWEVLNSNVNSNLYGVYFINNNTGFVCGLSSTMLKTTDSGLTWFYSNNGLTSSLYDVEFVNDSLGYCCGSSGIFKTVNSGGSWFSVFSGSQINELEIVSENTIYAGGYLGVFRTTNQGLNWNNTISGYSGSIWGLYFNNDFTGYAMGTIGTTKKTTNSGLNWFGGLPWFPGEYTFNECHFLNSGTGFVLFSSVTPPPNSSQSSGIYKVNSMNNFVLLWSVSNRGLGGLSFTGNDTAFAVGGGFNGSVYEAIILRSIDGGESWLEMQSNFINQSLSDVYFINSKCGFAVGRAGTIIRTLTGGISSLISTSSNIPLNFSLSQNYPNPFNPETTINFSIPSVETTRRVVSLIVYDISGREVATLINQQITPGTYSVNWDASNYPSGVYFYRLSSGEFTQTNKMILIK